MLTFQNLGRTDLELPRADRRARWSSTPRPRSSTCSSIVAESTDEARPSPADRRAVHVRDRSVRRADGPRVRGPVRADPRRRGRPTRDAASATSTCSTTPSASLVLAAWNATDHAVPRGDAGRPVRGAGGARRRTRWRWSFEGRVADATRSSTARVNRLARLPDLAGCRSGVVGGAGDAAVAGSAGRHVRGASRPAARTCRWTRISRPTASATSSTPRQPVLRADHRRATAFELPGGAAGASTRHARSVAGSSDAPVTDAERLRAAAAGRTPRT